MKKLILIGFLTGLSFLTVYLIYDTVKQTLVDTNGNHYSKARMIYEGCYKMENGDYICK